MSEDELCEKLAAAFGAAHPFSWPAPHLGMLGGVPAKLNALLVGVGLRALTKADVAAYWRERSTGQDFREDAGGYGLRCWSVALGERLPNSEVISHAEAITHALRGKSDSDAERTSAPSQPRNPIE